VTVRVVIGTRSNQFVSRVRHCSRIVTVMPPSQTVQGMVLVIVTVVVGQVGQYVGAVGYGHGPVDEGGGEGLFEPGTERLAGANVPVGDDVDMGILLGLGPELVGVEDGPTVPSPSAISRRPQPQKYKTEGRETDRVGRYPK